MEFKPVQIKGPDHKSAFFKRLIRHDILMRSQMYHKVIMEYFPTTKQNMVKSLNCLLTLGVKIAHLKTVEGCLLWVRLPAGSLGDESHFTLSQSLIIHVISHPLLQRDQNRLQWNHQLHMRWHKSGTQNVPYAWIVCCWLIIRHVFPPPEGNQGVPFVKSSVCSKGSYIQACKIE